MLYFNNKEIIDLIVEEVKKYYELDIFQVKKLRQILSDKVNIPTIEIDINDVKELSGE